MSYLIIDNSYWFVNESNPEEPKMSAICQICHLKENKGWLWEGKSLGYGDYDLYCNSCGKAIYIRDKNETQTNS